MSIQDLTALADRLSSIAWDAEKLAMTPEEIIQELRHLAKELNQEADLLDLEMERQFIQEYAVA